MRINSSVPLPVVIVLVGATLAGVGYVEKKGLDNLEPKEPPRVSCIRCHTDRPTLKKMAEKANDPLFLVHHGDVTLAELRELMSERNKAKTPIAKPGAGHSYY